MDFPEPVMKLIEEAAAEFPESPDAAAKKALKDVRKLPIFSELASAFIFRAFKELIYEFRHRVNTEIKNKNGGYGGGSKVNLNSESVKRVSQSAYNFYLAGRTLGEMTGKELGPAADAEESRANGHLFNAKLFRWVAGQGVGPDQRVRDAVSEKKLQKQIDLLQKEFGGDEAA